MKWKRRIAKLYPLSVSIKRSRKIVLIYHAVGSGPWSIPTSVFQQHVTWLAKHCIIVPLTELLNSTDDHKIRSLRHNMAMTSDGKENGFFLKGSLDPVLKQRVCASPPVQVALTFDDGYACLYDTVLPILNAVKAVGTVYLNTGWIDQESRKASRPELGHYPGEHFLTWNEVKILDKAGWEIGSHGVEHIDLTKQQSDLIEKELRHSKDAIEYQLKKPCEHFAYTFGRHDGRMRNVARQVGYRYAAAAHHQPLSISDDKMALPRLNVELGYSIEDFQNIVLGKWDFMGHIHRIKKVARV